MATILKKTINRVNIFCLLALYIGLSSTLYAAQHDVDDQKEQTPQNNKKASGTVWACPMCTFINKTNSKSCAMCYTHRKITTCHKDNTIEKGLTIGIEPGDPHSPGVTSISCPYIKDAHPSKSGGLALALKCPIYSGAKEHYLFTKDALVHLHYFTHFLDEDNEKPVCRHGVKCKSLIRLQDKGNLDKDLFHMKLYQHPPQCNRQIQLNENTHQFVCHQNKNANQPLYKPTKQEKDNLLRLLVDEVIKHGYRYDLCLTCKQNKQCNHDVDQKNNKNSLICTVKEQFNHPRYKKMGRPFHGSAYSPDALMLSLLLYREGDCSSDLCNSQSNGDYDKWKMFDYCLWHAVCKLSAKEYRTYKLYLRLNKPKSSSGNIDIAYFPTYTSTTTDRDIAARLIGKELMVLEIDASVRTQLICCDLSWIAKLGDKEHEILVARTVKGKPERIDNATSVKILDNTQEMQPVLLTKNCDDIIPKIACMIRAEAPAHQVTDSDLSIFTQLVANRQNVSPDILQKWKELRNAQQTIKINIKYMYKHYKVFIPLLIASGTGCINLLLLDKIAALFPNVTHIICAATDSIINLRGEAHYFPDIVNAKFMLGLQVQLSKMAKKAKLNTITIQTHKPALGDYYKLYAPQFAALGWKIAKESYENEYKDTKKNNQITLTKVGGIKEPPKSLVV